MLRYGGLGVFGMAAVHEAGLGKVPRRFQALEDGDGAVIADFGFVELKEQLLVASDDDYKAGIAEPEALLLVNVLNIPQRKDKLGPRARQQAAEAKVAVTDVDL